MAKQYYIDENGNAIPVSGTITTAQMLPLTSSPTSPTTADAIANQKVKSVLLTTTVTSTFSDSATIGYRGTGPNITTLTGYPTGKNILCAYVEYSHVGGATYPALSHIVSNIIYVTSKNSGTVDVGVRVLYTETA